MQIIHPPPRSEIRTAIIDIAPALVAAVPIGLLFGAGLDRNVEGLAAQTIAAVNRSSVPVVAVDLPSGINGATGKVMGAAIEADESVTFFRLKPGHLLVPGRKYCGKVTVADIGIRADCLATIKPKTAHNLPTRWTLPRPPHTEQVRGEVPGRQHVPAQVGQTTAVSTVTSRCAPKVASTRSSYAGTSGRSPATSARAR